MKKRSYVTETGIRIPEYNIKWMTSPKSSKSKGKKRKTKGKTEVLDLCLPAKKNSDSGVYINQLTVVFQSREPLGIEETNNNIIAVEDWKESEQGGS